MALSDDEEDGIVGRHEAVIRTALEEEFVSLWDMRDEPRTKWEVEAALNRVFAVSSAVASTIVDHELFDEGA